MKQTQPIMRRSFPLIDIEINRGGDGRTVTAYAATFGEPYEVRDQFGHYLESISPTAFNMAIGRGIQNVQVFYNHGMNPVGGQTPSDMLRSIGVPLSITPDAKGLLTVTRYGKSPLAEGLLQDIRDGILRSQSFRGPIYATAPDAVVRGSSLPLKERTQLGLIEYGPTPFAVNSAAEMVSVRSMTEILAADPEDLTDEERAAVVALASRLNLDPHSSSPDGDSGDTSDTETPPPVVVDPASDPTHLAQAQRRRRAA